MNFSAAVQNVQAKSEEIKAREIEKTEEKVRQVSTVTQQQQQERFNNVAAKVQQQASVSQQQQQQRFHDVEAEVQQQARAMGDDAGVGAVGAIMIFVFGEYWFTYGSVIVGLVLVLYLRKLYKK